MARQEAIFRAVLGGGLPASAYERMVGELVPTHSGELSRRHTHICLSKAARCANHEPDLTSPVFVRTTSQSHDVH
eukprot:COSAG04_NODE_1132_length_8130_cov_3.223882_10_plen_75_part_00